MTEEEKGIQKMREFHFEKTYATNVVVEETDADVRLYFFNEIVKMEGNRVAISDGVAMLTQQATILLSEQLNSMIESWKSKGQPVMVSEERRKVLEELKKES
jgi:hypothetical protein